MNAIRLAAFGILLVSFPLQAAAQQSSTVPQHAPSPLVGSLAGHPGWPSAKNTGDVDTVEHLVAALYDVISGPQSKPRDWDRFRSLFLPDGRLGVIRPDAPATAKEPARKSDAVFLTPDMYVERDDPYFKRKAFSNGVSQIVSKSSATSCMFGALTRAATQLMMLNLLRGGLTRSRSSMRRGATGWPV